MKLQLPVAPAVLFIVLAAALLGAFFFFQKSPDSTTQAALQPVAVQRADIEEVVTAQGKLEPKDYVDVGVQVSGQLDKIYVAIGDAVKKGDLIAEIDPAVYQSKVAADEAQLKSLNAQLAEQKAQADFARNSLERNRRLIKAKAISQETLEDAQTALKVADAKVASIEAQIEQATSSLEGNKANLSYTKIYAPMDGTVVSQPVREGQTLNANQTAPIVVQVANLDIMTVRTQVAEADISRLSPDMDVYFTTLGAPERKWHGKVRQILPSPETINDVVLYNALVDVKNTGLQLMTGMSTQVFFVVGRAEKVLVIPVRALGKPVPGADGKKTENSYRVKVDGLGGTQDRVVEIGLMTRTQAEVKSGLKEGDKILVPAADPANGKNGRSSARMPGMPGRAPML